jgi:hypothetical protein
LPSAYICDDKFALDHHSSPAPLTALSPPSRRRNPNSHNLDRPIARHHVALCYCKPGAHQISQHPAAEDMAMNELFLVDSKPAAG